MTWIWDWSSELDIGYQDILIPLITTLFTLIVGYKLRPWIGCKIGLHKWQTISLQLNDIDVQSYGRICWDDCYVQVWSSSGFVDREKVYIVLRQRSKTNQIVSVGDGRDTISFMLSDSCPYIIQNINGHVIFDILSEVKNTGSSENSVFRGEFIVYSGIVDNLLNCPNYRVSSRSGAWQKIRNVWYRWQLKWMVFRLRKKE